MSDSAYSKDVGLINQVMPGTEKHAMEAITEESWIDVIHKMDSVYANLVDYQVELEENAFIFFQIKSVDHIDQIVIEPAAYDQASGVATVVVFDAEKRLEFTLMGEIEVVSCKHRPISP